MGWPQSVGEVSQLKAGVGSIPSSLKRPDGTSNVLRNGHFHSGSLAGAQTDHQHPSSAGCK